MSNGITWMYSENGGYFPCSNSQEIEQFKKAGYVECGSPVCHKNGFLKIMDRQWEKSQQEFHEESSLMPKNPFASPIAEGPIAEQTNELSSKGLSFLDPGSIEKAKNGELSKKELLDLAADSGIAIDGRWNAQRIKEALGL